MPATTTVNGVGIARGRFLTDGSAWYEITYDAAAAEHFGCPAKPYRAAGRTTQPGPVFVALEVTGVSVRRVTARGAAGRHGRRAYLIFSDANGRDVRVGGYLCDVFPAPPRY